MLHTLAQRVPWDGNAAADQAVYALLGTSFIYPITPLMLMSELFFKIIDCSGKKNVWGYPVRLSILQAECGATSAGTLAVFFTPLQCL